MELVIIYQLGGGGIFGVSWLLGGTEGGNLSSPTEYKRGSIKH